MYGCAVFRSYCTVNSPVYGDNPRRSTSVQLPLVRICKAIPSVAIDGEWIVAVVICEHVQSLANNEIQGILR